MALWMLWLRLGTWSMLCSLLVTQSRIHLM
jgi:hypothetical protein